MLPEYLKTRLITKFAFITIILWAGCNEWTIPPSLPGTYTGQGHVILRYLNNEQFIYRDENVLVSLVIEKDGQVTGMVGEATFGNCKILKNRGWVGRQLGIKTDFLIKGSLQGSTFAKDTFYIKEISIPFNLDRNELIGGVFMNFKGESLPLINFLKLQKMK